MRPIRFLTLCGLVLFAPLAVCHAQHTSDGRMTVIHSRYWYPRLQDTLEQVDYLANNRVRVDIAAGQPYETKMFADLDSEKVTVLSGGSRQYVPIFGLPEMADTMVLATSGKHLRLLGMDLVDYQTLLQDGSILTMWVTRSLPKELTHLMAARMSMNASMDDPRFKAAAALDRMGAAVIRMEQKTDGEVSFYREITSIEEQPVVETLLTAPR